MELDVRDWMIIIGILLIVVVLLDGYRRVRNERRGNIRMSLNKQFLNASAESTEEHSSELPNGGARTVGRRQSSRAESAINSDAAATHAEANHTIDDDNDPLFSGGPAFGDGQLDLDQTVPMLMESVADDCSAAGDSIVVDDSIDDSDAHFIRQALDEQCDSASDQQSSDDDVYKESLVTRDQVELQSEPEPPRNRQSSSGEAQEVVVINVVAKDEPFKGPDLLHILLACDLRFGHMNIFHRYEQANGSGAVQFSMANSVEPGTFDLDHIDDFTTPGVCFFMSVPGPEKPIKAFEFMVETAQCLVTNLNGEMRDESRSAMTNQTLEHCRQRIQEFERRQLAQHA